MKKSIHLLVIDPQNDFCDLPLEYLPTDPAAKDCFIAPQLAVPGAHADMQRLSSLVHEGSRGITDMTVTLDSHHRVGIERPALWMNGDGTPLLPFTSITAAEVRDGRYRPRNAAHLDRVLAYLDALERAGRYQHRVWTPHCEIGTWGHAVHHDLRTAYNAWEDREQGFVNKVFKGSNPWTEHFSAIQAEVPDAEDPATQLNHTLLANLDKASMVIIAGEAGSHCVRATTEHIVDNVPGIARKLVLLTDCISPVTGFEQHYADFLRDMAAKGINLATAAEVTSELVVNARR